MRRTGNVCIDGVTMYISQAKLGARTLTGLGIYRSRTLLPCRSPALCFECILTPPPSIGTFLPLAQPPPPGFAGYGEATEEGGGGVAESRTLTLGLPRKQA